MCQSMPFGVRPFHAKHDLLFHSYSQAVTFSRSSHFCISLAEEYGKLTAS